MKKLFLPILLLTALVISGCEGMGLGGDATRLVAVTARISELTPTRTTIGDNLLSVKWKSGDCIGVSGKSAVNYCFGILAESDGQTSGVFEGSIAGNITSAYYPYSTSAGKDATAAELTMPALRTITSGEVDMRYDFMVSTNPEGSPKKGYTMTMVQKSALLNCTVKPNTYLVGASLQSLKIKVPQRELAGKFKMDLTDMDAPLAFTASSDSVVITLSNAPEMVSGSSVSIPFFLNPAIAEGDSIHITLVTDRGNVFIDLKAEKTLAAGTLTEYALDIETLVKNEKAHIPGAEPISAGTFPDLTLPGVYNVSDINNITPIVTYRENIDQYAVYTSGSYSYYRILSFQGGYLLVISTPKSPVPGALVSLTSDNVGLSHVPASTSQVRCVSVTSTMGWFIDEANRLGYILPR